MLRSGKEKGFVMTVLKSFLEENKIDVRRIYSISAKLEGLQTEDRALKLAKRRAKKGEDQKKNADAPKEKPRSGRPVTTRALQDLFAGKSISGPTKSRILRAINHILTQRKKEPVDLKKLFG